MIGQLLFLNEVMGILISKCNCLTLYWKLYPADQTWVMGNNY